MKKTLLLLIISYSTVIGQGKENIFTLSLGLSLNGNARIPDQSIKADQGNENIIMHEPIENKYQGGGILCSNNVFWAMQISGGIEELTLSGGVITSNGVIGSGLPNSGALAHCNNVSGGAYSPTFYGTASTSHASTYNGSVWDTSTASVAPYSINNPGGEGDYLYYVTYNGALTKSIVRFYGGVFTTVYTFQSGISISVADLAVDSSGNCWFFTSQQSSIMNTDTIRAVSPAGQIIAQMPFSINTTNAFGMFMMNGIIYIGFGASNPAYPNSLLPLTISGNNVLVGTAIPFPSSTIVYYDLAGCNPGFPTGVESASTVPDFQIFPNPAHMTLTVQWPASNPNEYPLEMTIIDVIGKQVAHTFLSREEKEVEVSKLEGGIYFLNLQSQGRCITRKFVKD